MINPIFKCPWHPENPGKNLHVDSFDGAIDKVTCTETVTFTHPQGQIPTIKEHYLAFILGNEMIEERFYLGDFHIMISTDPRPQFKYANGTTIQRVRPYIHTTANEDHPHYGSVMTDLWFEPLLELEASDVFRNISPNEILRKINLYLKFQ